MRRPSWSWLDWALIGTGFALLLAAEPYTGGDGLAMYEAARSLLAGHWPDEKYSLVTPCSRCPWTRSAASSTLRPRSRSEQPRNVV